MAHSKYTPERVDTILTAIRGGNYSETAASLAGVGKSTFYEWVEKYPDFADAVEEAKSEAEANMVALIVTAARTSWQAAAWYLERTKYKRWGRKDKIEHSGKIETVDAIDAEIERLRVEIAAIPERELSAS